MGIRMLNRRPAEAQADADAASSAPPPVPAFAAGASTARVPTDPLAALRRTAANARRRLTRRGEEPAPGESARPHDTTPPWRLWADLACGYLALLLDSLPRSRPVRTVTVFVASAVAVTGRRDGSRSAPPPSPPPPPGPLPGHRGPGPDAAP
ncbi:hypothetical protein GCM10010389_02660 [Streptomyces echinoruber]|uniref:Uncharacterized protein n=1 Tax=Streptomyces echinoruber TaxID=68898 RepID=A0A918V4R6_9ACTN|nr:hypothetical protein GCM10010389_02660 [Streptomyces echinoruber]